MIEAGDSGAAGPSSSRVGGALGAGGDAQK